MNCFLQASGICPELVLPHASYLFNLGSPDEELRAKSLDSLIDDLRRCESLGIPLYNLHPGSSCGKMSRDRCADLIATGVNEALRVTSGVKVVLENMCGQGNTLGGDFRELRRIIDGVKDKTRIGVCLDTCHAMAKG